MQEFATMAICLLGSFMLYRIPESLVHLGIMIDILHLVDLVQGSYIVKISYCLGWSPL